MQRIATRLLGRATRLRASKSRNEDGLTLVEVIVSISLLGIFAITFAPILYTNLDITARQATIAYAAQRTASYIDDARDATSATCDSLLAATSNAAPKLSTDPRSVRVKVSSAVNGCATPPVTPTAVTLTVVACEPATGSADTDACTAADRILTRVSTQILVRG